MVEIGQDFPPKQGDIIRLPIGCEVILGIYMNDKGESILKLLFAKNVVKLQEPEFLPLDMAYSLGMQLADEDSLFDDLMENRRWYEKQSMKLLNLLKPFLPTSTSGFNPDDADIPY